MRYLKYFKHIALFNVVCYLFQTKKSVWKSIGKDFFLVLFPLLIFTVLVYIIIISYSFLFWELPNNVYFPFITGNEGQAILDRFLLMVGGLLWFMSKFEDL